MIAVLNVRAGAVTLTNAAFKVIALGKVADAVMRRHERGHVLAVFRRSFYVQFGNDVVCLGAPALGQGPLNALCVLPGELLWSDELQPKAVAWRNTSVLLVDNRFEFDFGSASLWQPPAPPAFSETSLRMGLRQLAQSTRRRGPGGLGALIADLCENAPLAPAEPVDRFLSAAIGPIVDLRAWLTSALTQSANAAPDVKGLIGLGPGLTPSGDDFLGGAMVATHFLGFSDVAGRVAAQVLPVAEHGTNLISACYLRCAATGQAAAVLFDALESVLTGGGDRLESDLDAIHAVGHTSGWDSLAGAVAFSAVLAETH